MSRLERWTVWLSAVATGLTGLGFLWAKYLVAPTEPWAVVNHPLEPWFLKAHIVVAPVFVFAVGLILTRHILPHIRNSVQRGRRSGLVMVWMLVPMAASGYLIQVVTAPPLVYARAVDARLLSELASQVMEVFVVERFADVYDDVTEMHGKDPHIGGCW